MNDQIVNEAVDAKAELTREEIREQIMQIVYQMEANNNFDYEQLSYVTEHQELLESTRALNILKAISEHIEEIDEVIEKNTDGWKTSRIAKTDLAILRVSVCEIYFIDEVPDAVSVNEAVEMAKKYSDERSYAFVNSVLGKVIRNK